MPWTAYLLPEIWKPLPWVFYETPYQWAFQSPLHRGFAKPFAWVFHDGYKGLYEAPYIGALQILLHRSFTKPLPLVLCKAPLTMSFTKPLRQGLCKAPCLGTIQSTKGLHKAPHFGASQSHFLETLQSSVIDCSLVSFIQYSYVHVYFNYLRVKGLSTRG